MIMRKNFTLFLVMLALPVFLAAHNPVLYLTFDHMDDDESEINDVMNGLMAIPNLLALLLLSPVIFRITRDYFSGNE